MSRIIACIAVFFAATPVTAEQLESSDPEAGQHAQLALDLNTIAVLPFEVLTVDPVGPEISVAAYNELRSQLEALGRFSVVEQSRVEPFADSDMSPAEIARELGVANIVQGSIQLMPPYYVLRLRFFNAQTERSRLGTTALIGVTDPTIKCAINPETALPDGISNVVDSVEQWLFPVAEPSWEQKLIIARSAFLDVSLTDEERMLGLRGIREANVFLNRGGPDQKSTAYSGSVVVAAAQLGLESEDEGIRHSMWFTMAGVGDVYLVEPLLHSLKNDDDVWVRTQAATTLAGFLDEPGVRTGLDYARVNDTEKMVRKAANLSMLSDAEQKEYWKAIVMSPSESDQARMRAISDLQRDHRNAEPLDDEIMQRAIALGTRSRDPRVRSRIWWNISKTGDTKVVEPMLQLLNNDPDERVRESVVVVLSHSFPEEPGVQEAIEGAKTNDSSPLVRKKAEEVMTYAFRR